MILNMFILLAFIVLKPAIHLLPHLGMIIIIKIELFLQIGLGFYGLWASIDKQLFILFLKVYGLLFGIYLLLKIPFLASFEPYYIAVPAIFTPLPFVLGWLVDKAFYSHDTVNDN